MNAERKIAQLRAREYRRVSADPSGRLESPEQQGKVNAQHAARRGWLLGEPYAEPEEVSASRYSRKAREEYARLLADIQGGTFGADILILWENSRGSRKVGEWVTLIESCEDARILIYITSDAKLYDPADSRDRRSLLEDAIDSEWESAKTSKRLRRSQASRAAEGRPNGHAPYGYRSVYDPRTGRLAAREPHPDEAPVVRELYARLRAGDTLRGIARDFGERGLTTRGTRKRPPGPFSPAYLRALALSPVYAALRVHQPATDGPWRLGRIEGAVKATWPALVSEEEFYAVHARLTDPSRRTSRPGRAKHLLSLIARCGECGGPLTVRYRREVREYVCRQKFCVRLPADDLDELATAVMLAYLGEPGRYERLRAPGADAGPELARVRTELSAARAELADWRARAARREVTAASFAAIEPGVIDGIERLEKRERELATPPELAALLPGDDLAASWEAAPVAARRRVAALLCRPGRLGYLRVMRCPVPGHRLRAEDRVSWDHEE